MLGLELGSVKTLCFVISLWIGLMMKHLTVGSRISHMLLHETAKAGEVGCHTGDTHHSALGCRGNRQRLGVKPAPVSSDACRGGKSPHLARNSNVSSVPGSALCSLRVLTHLIFSTTTGSEATIISILQMKKLRHSKVKYRLPKFTKPRDGGAVGFPATCPTPETWLGTATLYCLSQY